MRTPTHHVAGAAAALLCARLGLVPVGGLSALGYAAVTAVFAGGRLSPDMDQRWKALDRALPDEILGGGGPLGHRMLAHWWGVPALVWFLAGGAAPVVAWVLHAVATAWGSHLAGDLVFGKANRRVGLRKGVPLLPWGWHVGLGLRADGLVERVAGAALVVLTGWLAWKVITP